MSKILSTGVLAIIISTIFCCSPFSSLIDRLGNMDDRELLQYAASWHSLAKSAVYSAYINDQISDFTMEEFEEIEIRYDAMLEESIKALEIAEKENTEKAQRSFHDAVTNFRFVQTEFVAKLIVCGIKIAD
jgi:hypothetical protein